MPTQSSPQSLSCVFSACGIKTRRQRKKREEGKEGSEEGGETNISNEAAGRRGDNSPTPTPQKQSDSCSFQNEGDGCTRQIPPTPLSGWLPPTARGAAYLLPLPRQHIIIIIMSSDLHWRRRWKDSEGRGGCLSRAATVSSKTAWVFMS